MTKEQKCQREAIQKWNGWGYTDSYFYIDDDQNVAFAGSNRYDISGKVLPSLHAWMKENLGIDIAYKTPSRPEAPLANVPEPIRNEGFLAWLSLKGIAFSADPLLRLNRSHGHTAKDMFELREGKVGRVPDLVVWPLTQGDVQSLIAQAERDNVAIIPIGGGTSVSHALSCPSLESRCVVSLDMCRMGKLLWVDPHNLVARAQAGIIGIDLEKQVSRRDECFARSLLPEP